MICTEVLGARVRDLAEAEGSTAVMPVYEYECAGCGTHFERYVRSFSESVACPACQGTTVEKQLSTFAMAGGASRGGGAGGGCGCGRGGCGCGH
jgi:putative FmdB family regulatory protein